MTTQENNEKQAVPAQALPVTFDVTTKLTKENISGVLCSAIEGGIGYWACIEEVVEPHAWTFTSEEGHHHYQDYPLNEGGALVFSIEDPSDVAEAVKRLRLDWAAIQTGLQIMCEKYPFHFCHIVEDNDGDGCTSDAETGDVLVQCALLGGIVYG
jgi:hypothetical protein